MKKYVLSLVLVLNLFVVSGKVFAQDFPDRSTVEAAYLLQHYGASTYFAVPGGSFYQVNGKPIRTVDWKTIQIAIDVIYQQDITDYKTYVQSLINQNNTLSQQISNLNDTTKAANNNIHVTGNEVDTDLQTIALLQAQIVTLKKQTCPIVKPTIITKTVTIPTSIVPVVTTPVVSPTSTPIVLPPTSVKKSFWQKVFGWL